MNEIKIINKNLKNFEILKKFINKTEILELTIKNIENNFATKKLLNDWIENFNGTIINVKEEINQLKILITNDAENLKKIQELIQQIENLDTNFIKRLEKLENIKVQVKNKIINLKKITDIAFDLGIKNYTVSDEEFIIGLDFDLFASKNIDDKIFSPKISTLIENKKLLTKLDTILLTDEINKKLNISDLQIITDPEFYIGEDKSKIKLQKIYDLLIDPFTLIGTTIRINATSILETRPFDLLIEFYRSQIRENKIIVKIINATFSNGEIYQDALKWEFENIKNNIIDIENSCLIAGKFDWEKTKVNFENGIRKNATKTTKK